MSSAESKTTAAGRSSTTMTTGTAKKQKMESVEDQVISEFNLIPLTKKKKVNEQIWRTYLSYRRAQQNKMKRNLPKEDRESESDKDSDCNSEDEEESEDEEDEDELLCTDPSLYAWRKLKDELDYFRCDGSDDVDSALLDQLKKSLHFSVSNAGYEDEDSLRGLDTTITFFSPYATPKAVQLSMDHYLRARYYSVEHHHNITIQFLNFNPEKDDPKVQTLATYQLDPQRMNVKNLNEKKVTQICKHLDMDSNDVNLRYILMKMLTFSSDWVDENDGGGYELNERKMQASGGDIADRNIRRRYGWLEYNLRNATKKVGAFHSCFEFQKVQQEEDECDPFDRDW